MAMQQEVADPLAEVDAEDDSAATKKNMEDLTLLNNEKELERYLTYGKWGLSDDDIVRLNKDEEMEQRVSILIIIILFKVGFFLQRNNQKKTLGFATEVCTLVISHTTIQNKKTFKSFYLFLRSISRNVYVSRTKNLF